MATVSYRLEDLKKAIVGIGYVGENDHMHVLIDCKEVFDEYPDAVPTMAIVPPVGEGYPKAVTRNGDVVEWLVKDSDVTVEGDGEFQLSFTEGEIIRKSVNARFRVKRSISGSGSAPSGVQDWLTDANEKLAEVEQATQDAEAAASHQPYIGIDGYWYTWNGEEFVKNVKAQGDKGDPGDPGSPGDPTQLIDDTAGEGQTGKTWSADKLDETTSQLLNAIHELQPNASLADVGKYLKAKTISNGRVTEYELATPSGGGGGSVEVQIPYELDGTGYIVYSNGDRNDSQNFNHTDYIDLSRFKSIKYKRTKSTSANPATGMAFYNESKQYVSGIQSATNQSDAGYESTLYEVEIPEGVTYARFSVYDNTQTYGTFEIYGITEGTAPIEYNTDGHATIKHYSVARTNEDGTKAFGIGTNKSETLFFTPQKNTNYGLQVSGNNRLRVYGTHVYYDPETVDISPICADIIVESEDLTEVSFNSSDYETILIYLNNGSNETSATYILANFGSRYIQDGVGDNSKEISEQNNLLNDEKFNLIPFISDSLPSTAVLYHAEWYKLVEKGLIERSQATYTTGDANHLYPLYTYTLKAYNEYMEADYEISSDPLSEIYERPKILVVSGHHGDEPCTPWALLNFFKRMLEDHYNADLLAQYEWTIIPMVNPYGYNNRSRYNANGVDINRDYNDSTGFASEEAQYVRNVFLADDYALTIDLHQTPFNESDYTDRRLGFTSMNEKRTGETQNEYDAIRKAFCHFIQGANAKTDRFVAEKYGYKQTKQTAFVWGSSNPTSNTFKNYTHGTGGNTLHTSHFADLSVTLETSTRCSYLSVSTTDYNQFTVQYTNEYVEEVIKAVVKVIEKIS